jgi:hypothetical protein
VVTQGVYFLRGWGTKKQRPEIFLTHHTPQFPKNKQRNERTNYDDCAHQEVIEAYVVERSDDNKTPSSLG